MPVGRRSRSTEQHLQRLADRLRGTQRVGECHEFSRPRTMRSDVSAERLESLVASDDSWEAHCVDDGALARVDPELAAFVALSASSTELEGIGGEHMNRRGRVGDARTMSA